MKKENESLKTWFERERNQLKNKKQRWMKKQKSLKKKIIYQNQQPLEKISTVNRFLKKF